nr:immunoglobulin heavy chain junction region [Mus musculus]MBK4184541.1 immunoglobulin heavy chain junction region [Mus musculus]MBK4184542.1 immunoglobulin heavy chain junction region [Mus musculus]
CARGAYYSNLYYYAMDYW